MCLPAFLSRLMAHVPVVLTCSPAIVFQASFLKPQGFLSARHLKINRPFKWAALRKMAIVCIEKVLCHFASEIWNINSTLWEMNGNRNPETTTIPCFKNDVQQRGVLYCATSATTQPVFTYWHELTCHWLLVKQEAGNC